MEASTEINPRNFIFATFLAETIRAAQFCNLSHLIRSLVILFSYDTNYSMIAWTCKQREWDWSADDSQWGHSVASGRL